MGEEDGVTMNVYASRLTKENSGLFMQCVRHGSKSRVGIAFASACMLHGHPIMAMVRATMVEKHIHT